MTQPACARVREELFEQARAGAPSPEMSQHLESCASCRRLNAQTRVFLEDQRALAERPMPFGLEERVFSRLRDDIAEAAAAAKLRNPWWSGWRAWWPKAVVGGGLALAAAVAVLLTFRPASTVDEVTRGGRLRGAVALRSKGKPVAPLLEGAGLTTENRIEVSSMSRAELLIGAERAMVMADSSVALESLAGSDVVLRLHQGTIVVEVAPGVALSKRFRVMTAQAEVQVTGTLFRVSANADSTRVDVAHGSVVVRAENRAEVTVKSGQQAVVTAGGNEVRAASPEVARELQAAFEMLDAAEPAAVVVTAPPDADEPPPPRAVRPIRRTSPSRQNTAAPATGGHLEQNLEAGECALAEAELQSLTNAPADVQAERSVAVADCFYAEGNLPRALARYEEVALRFAQTPSAANATYERGRVAAQLGQLARAQAGFDAYLERFPSGPLAGEALFRKCGLLQLQQLRAQSLTCLEQYRSRFPTGPRAAASHYQEGTLLRESGDCPGALRAYARYLKNPGPLAASAREWSAWCKRATP